jgi:hypothetical protein
LASQLSLLDSITKMELMRYAFDRIECLCFITEQLYYKSSVKNKLQVSFLNITGFRDFPLGDLPMLQVCKIANGSKYPTLIF